MGKYPRKRREVTRPIIQTSFREAMAEGVGSAISRDLLAKLKTMKPTPYSDTVPKFWSDAGNRAVERALKLINQTR